MMKYYTFLVMLFLFVKGNTQEVNKLRAESVAIKFQNNDGTWKEWTDWKESDVLIVLNDLEQRFTLYTDPKEVYDYIASPENFIEDGYDTFKVRCVDNKGVECIIKLLYGKENKLQMYIQYSNMIVAYNVNPING